MQTYFIAKYVDDIRRNEPVNVGVIVVDGGTVTARFEGEDEGADTIDKRRIRRLVTGRDTYVAWVQHWRRVIDGIDVNNAGSAIDALAAAHGARDFYLELGGTVLLDHDDRPADRAVRELYADLVKPDDQPTPPSLKEKSLAALRLAGANLSDEKQFQKDVAVQLSVAGQPYEDHFSYAVKNGTWHYLQEVSFDPQKPAKSRKEANNCAFLVEHAQVAGARVVLFDGADIDDKTEPFLDLLNRIAVSVDVGDSAAAATALQNQLHIGAGGAPPALAP